MRTVATNDDDSFRVKAYAGTNGVLLAFDVDEPSRAGLLGFAIESRSASGKWRWLLNRLTFPGHTHTIPDLPATPTNIAPIQKFRWADYSVEPGVSSRYRVHLVYGSADDPQLGEHLEVSVTTSDGKPAGHHVVFNRAVAASQAFNRQFPQMVKLLKGKNKPPIEKWPDAPRKWLEHGLLDQIIRFIERARDGKWGLDIAIYEYELKAIVDAVNAAHKRGVDVRVLYHARVNDEQREENEASLKKIPGPKKRARVTSKIFHDKFIVLNKIGSDGARVPQSVLCGSTNFTENGVYRQANVTHIIDLKPIAQSFSDLFEQVWETPEDVAAARDWITENNAISGEDPVFVGFSPRHGGADLDTFVDIIRNANRDVLFATAFELPATLLNALLGAVGDDVLRFGIQNNKSIITGIHEDRSDDFTAKALLPGGLEGWTQEGMLGQEGGILIHLKMVITDFTTDHPTIISGSHNLSGAASDGNDENFLIMRGDTDLADRYGLEILRFYDHYRYRYWAKLLKLKKVRPLTIDDSWSARYFEFGSTSSLARLRFAGR